MSRNRTKLDAVLWVLGATLLLLLLVGVVTCGGEGRARSDASILEMAVDGTEQSDTAGELDAPIRSTPTRRGVDDAADGADGDDDADPEEVADGDEDEDAQPGVFCPAEVPEDVAGDRRAAGTLIMVWKSQYKLGFYREGKLEQVPDTETRACFDIAMGGNPVGPKRRQGDQKTPEGWYWVSWKIPHGSTQFYKALYVNYPNAEDAAIALEEGRIDQRMHDRIASAAKNHSTVTDSPLGALIEIHGCGSKPRNWTLGCIALDNPNMDYLYDAAESGQTAILILP